MAEVKISELSEHLVPANSDLLEVSRDDGGGNFTSMRITKGNLIDNGDVVGPIISEDSNIALFSGVTGKIIRDSGFSAANSLAKNNFTAVIDPTGDDDITQGYSPNSVWINQAKANSWLCISATATNAVWDKGGSAAYMHSAFTPNIPEDAPSWWDTEDGFAAQYYDNAGDPVYVQEDPLGPIVGVRSEPENGIGAIFSNFIVMTQAEYDASDKNLTTMYAIVG